ncbi:MAG: hypothetical protein AAB289_03960 [Chloroflexota bacterium]
MKVSLTERWFVSPFEIGLGVNGAPELFVRATAGIGYVLSPRRE